MSTTTYLHAFDLETTGVDTSTARIVTAFVGAVSASGAVAESNTWVIRPEGYVIPDEAAAVHGYTTERATAEGQDGADAVRAIVAALSRADVICGHNLAYDMSVLVQEMRRYDVHPDPVAFVLSLHLVDTFVLDKAVDPYRKGKRTLSAVAAHYGVALDDAHAADADAVASAQIALKLQARGVSIDHPTLMDDQAALYRNQMNSLTAYRRRTDPNFTADTGWPLRADTIEEDVTF